MRQEAADIEDLQAAIELCDSYLEIPGNAKLRQPKENINTLKKAMAKISDENYPEWKIRGNEIIKEWETFDPTSDLVTLTLKAFTEAWKQDLVAAAERVGPLIECLQEIEANPDLEVDAQDRNLVVDSWRFVAELEAKDYLKAAERTGHVATLASAIDAAEELVLRRASPTSKLYKPLKKAKNLLEMLEIEEELKKNLTNKIFGYLH